MASDFDTIQAAASVYADSLFQLADTGGKLDVIADQLNQIQELWQKDANFAAMMSAGAIDDDARRDMIRKAFQNRVDPLVLNLMLVLNDKHRSAILPHVCQIFRKKLDVKLGREEAFVTTAVALESEQRSRIEREIQRLTGLKAIIVEKVDPDILGGLKIQVADRVYDMTVRRRLREMRERLMTAGHVQLHKNASRFATEGTRA